MPSTELRHLCGRIGELYAALLTNGQMATAVNQKGYDVVAGNGEYISVKTTANMSANGHFAFNPATLSLAHRVMILRVNTDEMQIETLFDASVEDARKKTRPMNGKLCLPFSQVVESVALPSDIKVVRSATYGGYTIDEIESGSIVVDLNGEEQTPTLRALRKLAGELNVSLLNGSGTKRNTRVLGSAIIRAIHAASGENPAADNEGDAVEVDV
ncbi:DUF6998 domain-containing protein [Paraburkholderia sp. GAS41]|uniref:DUF6998 domain-containing protein n=1 Tax=Paraburkholderia sp. GAS41 TaxID=3035134 RepID=UPI003D2305B8